MTTSPYDYAAQHTQRFRDELMEFLRIPSISTDPLRKDDVSRAAEWLAGEMARIGLEHVQVMQTNGHPVVYGDWLRAGDDKPTILIYGHYDVQPAVMEDGWTHPPFDPQIRENRIYARGSADDKGQVMSHLKAAESLLNTSGFPVNVKYLFEGEEEIGSPNLGKFIEENRTLLHADLCVISDTGIRGIDQPSINYSLRGLLGVEVTVRGPLRDMHSGNGGVLHNPAQAIAEIVAKLHLEDGRVAVPGFYEDVFVMTPDEREALKQVEVTKGDWQSWMGDLPEWGEPGYSKIERIGARPTLEINGIFGGYTGEGQKTVIPAFAKAKITCRLVANQDPEKIFVQIDTFIHAIAPKTVKIEVENKGGSKAARTPIEHPGVQAAVRAFGKRWTKPVLFIPGGGSIPVVVDIQETLSIPVVLLGFSLPDAGAHGPNESFHLEMYSKAVDTIIAYLHEIASPS